jgi:hypothetical protein
MTVTKNLGHATNLANLHINQSHSGTMVLEEIQTEAAVGNSSSGSRENQYIRSAEFGETWSIT